MGRTIILSDIKIVSWVLDVDNRNVTVNYRILDQDSNLYDDGQAIFWENLPVPQPDLEGNPGSNPDNWYQLPLQYSQALTDITLAARSGLLQLLD